MARRSTQSFWRVLLAVALGAFTGLSVFTFSYAQGGAYLGDDPAACINCHVMQGQYDGWSRASHASVAVCNDCHAPTNNALSKYAAKAVNGAMHSWAFTTGRFPDNIQITEFNRRITEASCRKCHQPITLALESGPPDVASISCVRCHRSVGHGP